MACANKQNGVEWPLLEGHTWMDWARSDVRIERLKRMVEIGHSYGIMVGVDVPIAFAQQHSFRLLKNGNGKKDHLDEEVKEIQDSLDWVMKAGFDFLGTESGTSEFTHSSPETMLNWMNAAADYVSEKYDITMFIKVHCSAGQIAKGYKDPRTNEDINFNMLPHFASSSLAPTYGNKDFGYIREYLNFELENGQRPVVFYPETAYWVPSTLTSPCSCQYNSTHKNRMDGQLIFASGWEWGYWLNDAMAARAAWNPLIEIADEKEALRQLLRPLSIHMNTEEDKKEAEDLIIEWTVLEKELLMVGKLEGHGYLEGWDTWDDVSKILGHLTQPDRLGLVEFKHGDGWFSHVKEHLWKHKKSDSVDAEYVTYTVEIAARAPSYMHDLWDDIADAGRRNPALAKEAMATLRTAQAIVNNREHHYRVDAERVAGWTNLNTPSQPTAYAFNYLWTVRSLHYWWRDAAEALNHNHRTDSSSFANIIDPIESVLDRVWFTEQPLAKNFQGKRFFNCQEIITNERHRRHQHLRTTLMAKRHWNRTGNIQQSLSRILVVLRKRGLIKLKQKDWNIPSKHMWWIGMMLQAVGELCNFGAYAFSPTILVAPLGTLAIVFNAILSHFVLHDDLSFLGKPRYSKDSPFVYIAMSSCGGSFLVLSAQVSGHQSSHRQELEYQQSISAMAPVPFDCFHVSGSCVSNSLPQQGSGTKLKRSDISRQLC
ncbi:hypothetical protein BCR33DRAFT_799950 [Rhizoclosmatium globosum]|uniref:Glycoside hydrolase n=1 Tax=Rhizoclosmatium globosum TaxID=329046 RepID=A0A1Y2A0U1_9FUNG|nr:hypothetical protein BCR33DRAFT_799950 [Rhizoclosmatium globosum]|eukprot:ORY15655.1 hypothetical protein BCR33DRAFT_799950 [Rhizoclosmatium globosum]